MMFQSNFRRISSRVWNLTRRKYFSANMNSTWTKGLCSNEQFTLSEDLVDNRQSHRTVLQCRWFQAILSFFNRHLHFKTVCENVVVESSTSQTGVFYFEEGLRNNAIQSKKCIMHGPTAAICILCMFYTSGRRWISAAIQDPKSRSIDPKHLWIPFMFHLQPGSQS